MEISLLDLWSQTSLASAKKTWLKVQGADVDEMQSLCLPRGYWPQEVMLLMRLLVLRPRDWKREGNLLQSLSDLGMKKARRDGWMYLVVNVKIIWGKQPGTQQQTHR